MGIPNRESIGQVMWSIRTQDSDTFRHFIGFRAQVRVMVSRMGPELGPKVLEGTNA